MLFLFSLSLLLFKSLNIILNCFFFIKNTNKYSIILYAIIHLHINFFILVINKYKCFDKYFNLILLLQNALFDYFFIKISKFQIY